MHVIAPTLKSHKQGGGSSRLPDQRGKSIRKIKYAACNAARNTLSAIGLCNVANAVWLTIWASMDLSFRQATEADSDLLADLVLGDAEQETTRVAMRLYGITDIEQARSLFRLLWGAGESWKRSELVLFDDEVCGILTIGGSSTRITSGFIASAVRSLGLFTLLRAAGRLRLQRRVVPEKPGGACVVSELHVAPGFRGRGLGQRMLAHAEEGARAGGYAVMALHTLTTNPARRLYERCGYEAVAELTDAEFERLTGASGNILFVKRLTAK